MRNRIYVVDHSVLANWLIGVYQLLVLFYRKEEEEKRRREEEALIGNVYKEFEEHFDDRPTAKINKTWVKAGTFNAGMRL